MPNNTGSPHYLPYPLLTEASDVPGDIHSLASQVHTRLNVSTPVYIAGSGIISAASGWTIDDRSGQKMNQVVHVQCRIVRAGGAISVDSGGRVASGAEVLVGTLTAPYSIASQVDIVGSYEAVDSYALFYLRGTSVYLAGVKPGAGNIPTGAVFRMAGTWMVAA
jgi:hypothetical protein